MLNRQVSGMLLDRKSFKSDAIFEKSFKGERKKSFFVVRGVLLKL